MMMCVCIQVKDARSGPGLKSMNRIKSRQIFSDSDYVTSRDCDMSRITTNSPGGVARITTNSPGGANDRRAVSLLRNKSGTSSMFIDSDYWTP